MVEHLVMALHGNGTVAPVVALQLDLAAVLLLRLPLPQHIMLGPKVPVIQPSAEASASLSGILPCL
jgi:hypothetical protein